MQFNLLLIAGNLVDNPSQLRTTNNGKKVCDFRLAANEGRGDSKKTTFIDVTCWEKTAEIVCQYLKRGSGVLVQGRLEQEEWTDKEGGKRSKHKIVATAVQFTDAKGSGEQQDDSHELRETPIAPPAPRSAAPPAASRPPVTAQAARNSSPPVMRDFGLDDGLPF